MMNFIQELIFNIVFITVFVLVAIYAFNQETVSYAKVAVLVVNFVWYCFHINWLLGKTSKP